jgi:hypothetical protein
MLYGLSGAAAGNVTHIDFSDDEGSVVTPDAADGTEVPYDPSQPASGGVGQGAYTTSAGAATYEQQKLSTIKQTVEGSSAFAFLQGTWLGLPVWAWLTVGALVAWKFLKTHEEA